MKDIIKIVIKGCSGYCSSTEAYDDKVIVERDAISYEYKPLFESDLNITRKWRYKTTSPIYKKLFDDLVNEMPSVINREVEEFWTDIGVIEFIVTFADKTKWHQTYGVPGEQFADVFKIIKHMVPGCEYVPAVLLTKEDYDEEAK